MPQGRYYELMLENGPKHHLPGYKRAALIKAQAEEEAYLRYQESQFTVNPRDTQQIPHIHSTDTHDSGSDLEDLDGFYTSKSFLKSELKEGLTDADASSTIPSSNERSRPNTTTSPTPLSEIDHPGADASVDASESKSVSQSGSLPLTHVEPSSMRPDDGKAYYNEDGWPTKANGMPLEPDPLSCCGNDCPNCVWIQYDEQVQKWKDKLKAKQLK